MHNQHKTTTIYSEFRELKNEDHLMLRVVSLKWKHLGGLNIYSALSNENKNCIHVLKCRSVYCGGISHVAQTDNTIWYALFLSEWRDKWRGGKTMKGNMRTSEPLTRHGLGYFSDKMLMIPNNMNWKTKINKITRNIIYLCMYIFIYLCVCVCV